MFLEVPVEAKEGRMKEGRREEGRMEGGREGSRRKGGGKNKEAPESRMLQLY